MKPTILLGLAAGFVVCVSASKPRAHDLHKNTPALPLGLYRHMSRVEKQQQQEEQLAWSSPSPQLHFESVAAQYPTQYFDQSVSHDPDVPSNDTFKQRYWLDASSYRAGGPVFLLDGGETDGAGRLPFLETGILRILAEATHGIGIVLEHRYYGQSIPVGNVSTDSLRFLTTSQSLYDGVHFARNVELNVPGLDNSSSLRPDKTPWVYYGGSYAGAKAALARKLFPDVWWGAIASSAVTTAIEDFWEYYEPIRQSAPEKCISLLQNHTVLIDSLLGLHTPFITSSLKNYFGLGNITRDEDFVNALTIPLSSWQARNWDPKVGSDSFGEFCDALTTGAGLEDAVNEEALAFPWPSNPTKTFAQFSTYAAYIKSNISTLCPPDFTQDECFGTDVGSVGDMNDLEEAGWKSWTYQYCTEWGYFIGAAPLGHPSLVSRLLTPDYAAEICKKAFPAGELNRVPDRPNVTLINQYGGYELSYPRLAYIDGSEDPWLYATPHSPHAKHPKRKSTHKHPFHLIPGGVHHWDENGLLKSDNEPKAIRRVHAAEVEFVLEWLREWEGRGKWRTGPWKE